MEPVLKGRMAVKTSYIESSIRPSLAVADFVALGLAIVSTLDSRIYLTWAAE